jgi:hypothetical protein
MMRNCQVILDGSTVANFATVASPATSAGLFFCLFPSFWHLRAAAIFASCYVRFIPRRFAFTNHPLNLLMESLRHVLELLKEYPKELLAMVIAITTGFITLYRWQTRGIRKVMAEHADHIDEITVRMKKSRLSREADLAEVSRRLEATRQQLESQRVELIQARAEAAQALADKESYQRRVARLEDDVKRLEKEVENLKREKEKLEKRDQ